MLSICDFGSYPVGGGTLSVSGQPLETLAVTSTASYTRDPNGAYAIEHAWVQYYVPSQRNQEPPIVLLHGGGMHGGMWDTTPDGRQGWLQLLLAAGYEVHVIDNVERGRAGWVPDYWRGKPVLRSLEEAWSLFRFGAPHDYRELKSYPGCRFPVRHLEVFGRYFCPRWVSNTPNQINAFRELLERLGKSIVFCHSQGAEIAFQAMALAPTTVSQLVAIEPSAVTADLALFESTPLLIVEGDYLDCNDTWVQISDRWRGMVRASQEQNYKVELFSAGAHWPGLTHMLMMDDPSAEILQSILLWLSRTVR